MTGAAELSPRAGRHRDLVYELIRKNVLLPVADGDNLSFSDLVLVRRQRSLFWWHSLPFLACQERRRLRTMCVETPDRVVEMGFRRGRANVEQLFLAVAVLLVAWWVCTVVVALVSLAVGANRQVAQFRRLRWAWIKVLAGHLVTLPFPVVWIQPCSPPPAGHFRDSSTIRALFLGLLLIAVITHIGTFIWAVFTRPSADVTDKHRVLLPAVWASLSMISLVYWGAAYLLVTMAWLG